MAGAFDAFYQWLGILPKEQPPNHYRLLGVALFEADSDVISNAVDQRMALLRTFQIGDHALDSQRLIHEVAVAMSVLLNHELKAHYDAQLYSGLQPPAPPVVKPLVITLPPPIQSVPLARLSGFAPVTSVLADFASERRASGISHRHRREQSRSKSPVLVTAIIVIGLATIIVVAWLLNTQRTTVPDHVEADPLPAIRSLPSP